VGTKGAELLLHKRRLPRAVDEGMTQDLLDHWF
jgi:hypothetical protein